MFNPIESHEVVIAVGLAARRAASSRDTVNEFERGQLLSAYSLTRHLAVELEHYPAALDAFTSSLASELREPGRDWGTGNMLSDAADAIEACRDAACLGAVVAELLAELREREDGGARHVQELLHRRLGELAQTEVELLADHIP
jgi:hypothetical protein